jgi:hypothetical protein
MSPKNAEFAKAQMWLEFLKRHIGSGPTPEMAVEELRPLGFWTEQEIARATRNWLISDARKWFQDGPTLEDDQGNPVEMVNIRTITEEGEVTHVYEGLPFIESYDDAVQICENDLRREKHFASEFIKHHDHFAAKLPRKQAAAFKKHFHRDYQRLLPLVVGIAEATSS